MPEFLSSQYVKGDTEMFGRDNDPDLERCKVSFQLIDNETGKPIGQYNMINEYANCFYNEKTGEIDSKAIVSAMQKEDSFGKNRFLKDAHAFNLPLELFYNQISMQELGINKRTHVVMNIDKFSPKEGISEHFVSKDIPSADFPDIVERAKVATRDVNRIKKAVKLGLMVGGAMVVAVCLNAYSNGGLDIAYKQLFGGVQETVTEMKLASSGSISGSLAEGGLSIFSSVLEPVLRSAESGLSLVGATIAANYSKD